MKEQIKSKERVAEHGEVFTNEREVKAMCDLVAHECERLDSRFLEPACGDGNFLAEIVIRKLEKCKKLYKNNPYDYERYSVLAMSSIYGVDILQDNILICRSRLFNIWNEEYTSICKKESNDETRRVVEYILSQNILCGNALTMMQVNDKQEDTELPIIFPEWSMIMGAKLKRRDFRLDVLLKEHDDENSYDQLSLFSEDASSSEYWDRDPETQLIIPKPIKEYPAVHYQRIMEVN